MIITTKWRMYLKRTDKLSVLLFRVTFYVKVHQLWERLLVFIYSYWLKSRRWFSWLLIFVQIPFVKACCKDEMEIMKILYLTISAVKNTMMPENKSFTMTSLRHFVKSNSIFWLLTDLEYFESWIPIKCN